MRTITNVQQDIATKKAWDENWKGINTQQILEIFEYPRVKKQIEIFKSYLPKNKRILEGGCGPGPYLVYFRGLNYNIIGLDYNYDPLVKISNYNARIPVVCADVLNIPFSNNSFGAYLSLGVIEHFTGGPEPAIKEAHRVLETGGYFIISVPRFSIFHKLKFPVRFLNRAKWLRRIFKKPPTDYYWEQYFKISELAGAVKRNNLEIIKIFPVDHAHALLAAFSIFRDKSAYDGVNGLGIALARFLEKYMPWSTAAAIIMICRKI